ncbi:hypothetical protein FJY94_04880 [Candidatus Kaiserbacteria bacterium]|nr:hypothetical protein [Candidatus Kaiserbacteria bacterium]
MNAFSTDRIRNCFNRLREPVDVTLVLREDGWFSTWMPAVWPPVMQEHGPHPDAIRALAAAGRRINGPIGVVREGRNV